MNSHRTIRSLLAFFVLTYAVTWACFFTAVALSGNFGSSVPTLEHFRTSLLYLGTFAPSLVAIAITAWVEGMPGVLALLRRLAEWQVAVRWYVFAIGYMAAIKIAVAIVHRLVVGSWPRFGNEAWYLIIAAIFLSTPIQAGEEIGWRGYALPRLAARFGFARASLVLGVIWALWHLPLFFVTGLGNYGQSFPIFALGSIALSAGITWLYVHVNGSLLLTMLMHSAVNQTVGIVPSTIADAANPFALSTSLVAWLTDALLWITALYFLVRMRRIE
jgi:hypothetical protein